MTRLTFACLIALLASPVAAQDVPSNYLAIEWRLITIDGQPFDAEARIDLSVPGQISGQGPCNRFFSSYDGTLPDFRPGAIGSTRLACQDLPAEAAFLSALSQMNRAEVVAGSDILMLTGPKGGSLEFIRPVN